MKVEVFLGGTSRLTGLQEPTETHVVTRARSIIVHPNYSDITKDNDIGLVELPRSTIFSSVISRILLPVGVEGTWTLAGRQGTVSGYGRFSDLEPYSSATLNYVRLPIVDNLECSRVFGALYVNEKHVCLQSSTITRQSACQG